MTAVIIIVVIAVGLPVLAFWLGGRTFWTRLGPGAEGDPWRDTMHRLGLTPQEMAKVEAAGTWGRRIEEPHLRPAVVAWAQQLLDQSEARRRSRPTWLPVAAAALLVAVLAAMTWQVLDDGVPWGLVVTLLVSNGISIWIAGGPRRAVRRNSDPTDREP